MIKIPGRVKKALEISSWLKDKGYKHDIDFTWRLERSADQIIVMCKNEKLETLIALRWSC